MTNRKVSVFFYGSYINLDVLKQVNFIPDSYEVAKLSGFDIVIKPLANLVKSDKDCVYGILTSGTHEEMENLYSHARNVLGSAYLPEAVLVETLDGKFKSVLCYISPGIEEKQAANDYINRIVEPAKKYGFPYWYIKKLKSFRS
jgi:hypothetical protein